jgi:hypothetical protein
LTIWTHTIAFLLLSSAVQVDYPGESQDIRAGL